MADKKAKVRLRKRALFLVSGLLILTYYLSSIPYLRVLPVLRQINNFLFRLNVSVADLARYLARLLPSELQSAGTLTGDFYQYARQNPVIIEFLLRKAAHVLLFFIITLAFFILWRHYFRPLYAIIVSFISGAVVAILDETYQHFVSGRTGNIVDVAIDLIGVSMAVVLILIAFFLIRPIYKRDC